VASGRSECGHSHYVEHRWFASCGLTVLTVGQAVSLIVRNAADDPRPWASSGDGDREADRDGRDGYQDRVRDHISTVVADHGRRDDRDPDRRQDARQRCTEQEGQCGLRQLAQSDGPSRIRRQIQVTVLCVLGHNGPRTYIAGQQARAAPYRAEFSLWRRRLRGEVLRFVKQVMQPARYTACMGKRSPLAGD